MTDLPGQTDTDEAAPEMDSFIYEETVPQIERIRRIGRRLFTGAECIVSLKEQDGIKSDSAGQACVAAELCETLPHAEEPVVISDLSLDNLLRGHRLVDGGQSFRFFAGHPVRDSGNTVIGSVCVVDRQPRDFNQDDRQLLADLAALVQRELHVQSMSAFQLDLQKKNKTLRRKSLVDPMIGIWNRGAIMRILMIEAVRCDKLGMPLSVIVLDLDHFKKINDTYGHPAGDTVLVKVAARLRSCIRSQEALGRYGGEEFLVVLPGSSHETALAVAERMRLAVESPTEQVGEAVLRLTISAGLASTDLFPNATTDELISRADVALYAAKDAGRNCVRRAQAN